MKRYLAPVFLAGMIHFAGGAYSQNLTVQIASPQNKAGFDQCSRIHIIADAQIQGGEIQEVVFYQNTVR